MSLLHALLNFGDFYSVIFARSRLLQVTQKLHDVMLRSARCFCELLHLSTRVETAL